MKILSVTQEIAASPALYIFDPSVFDAETDITATKITDRHRHRAALEGRDFSDADMAATNQYLAERSAFRTWSEAYAGKVPKSWGGEWDTVVYDIESGRTGMTSEMVEAAVHYPHRLVVLTVAVNYSLAPDQRAYVDSFEWEEFERQQIIASQQSLVAQETPSL